MTAAAPAAPFTGAELRFSALRWSLLHIPVIILLYLASIQIALDGVPMRYQAGLILLYTIEAAVACGLVWFITLPLSLWPRVYRYAAPAIVSIAMVLMFIDSRLYLALNFHINAFFFKVVTQPGMTTEVGLNALELILLTATWLTWFGVSIGAGAWFVKRCRCARRVWPFILLFVSLEVVDRLSLAVLNFYGGPAVFAAGQVLPLQVRFTMNRRLSNWTGRPMIADPLENAAKSSRAHLPAGVAPEAVQFTRRPDVILALIESTRADFLDAVTMPRLWERGRRGALFERHYSAATSTHYSVFSLFYALQSHKLEAVVGAGRPPLLFGALQHNGYATRLIAASSVDWMGMRRTVFGAVENDLITDVPGNDGASRDASMLAIARRTVAAADTAQPLFLFLFFDGTHFTYSFPRESAMFRPYWDGRGSGGATRVAAEQLRNRARNAAYEVDRKLDAFITWFTQQRGGEPLVLVTGDHGEEYREHGRVGHGSAVTVEQAHVPMVLSGPGVTVGTVASVTSSVDIVPTLFAMLGDTLTPSRYSDGMSMFNSPLDRFVLTTVGWEPKFAVIGRDLKASFATYDAALGSVLLTDPWDRPLADANQRFAAEASNILRAFALGARP